MPTPTPSNEEKELLTLKENIIFSAFLVAKIIGFTILLSLACAGFFDLDFIDIYEQYSLLIGFLFLLINLIYWYYLRQKTFFTITNQRLILSQQLGIFKNQSYSINLNKIKETAFKKNQFLGEIFGYGEIMIHADSEFLESRFLKFPALESVREVKLYLDKIVALIQEGVKRDDLPLFAPPPVSSPEEVKDEGKQKIVSS